MKRQTPLMTAVLAGVVIGGLGQACCVASLLFGVTGIYNLLHTYSIIPSIHSVGISAFGLGAWLAFAVPDKKRRALTGVLVSLVSFAFFHIGAFALEHWT